MLGCKEGHAVDEWVDEGFTTHVLVLVDDVTVGLAYLVYFVGVVTDYIEKTVYFLFILNSEVVAASEESDVDFLFILLGVIAEAKAVPFEL